MCSHSTLNVGGCSSHSLDATAHEEAPHNALQGHQGSAFVIGTPERSEVRDAIVVEGAHQETPDVSLDVDDGSSANQLPEAIEDGTHEEHLEGLVFAACKEGQLGVQKALKCEQRITCVDKGLQAGQSFDVGL